MRYTSIDVDGDGVSHFGNVEVVLAASDFAPPAPPVEVSAGEPADRVVFFRAPPGWRGDWHPTPRRQYFVCVAGGVEVTVGDGETRTFGPGAVVRLEDTWGTGHVTRVIGDEPCLAVFAQLPDGG